MDHDSRENWLTRAANLIEPFFREIGYEYQSKVRYACGFPSGCIHLVLGQCWCRTASADGTFEIFISPRLADALDVLGVLAHEMVHAVVGIPAGHRTAFRRCALGLGLTGPMTSTVPGPQLRERLNALCHDVGPYPHAQLPQGAPVIRHVADAPRPQTARLFKLCCPSCGYLVWTTRKWIARGLPSCACGTQLNPSTVPSHGLGTKP